MARAYEAIWDLPLPQGQRSIGELRATSAVPDSKAITLHVGSDRAYDFKQPFSSVRDYLRAFIHFNLNALEKQEEIDPYKQRYLSRIKSFIETGMHNIPEIVETIPIVFQHCDLAPHNVILKAIDPTSPSACEIAAIIDWEFVGSFPFMSASRSIEMLFRKFARNDFGLNTHMLKG